MRTSLLPRSGLGLLLVVISLALFVLQLAALAYGGMVAVSTVVPRGTSAWEFLVRADASALLLGAIPSGLVAYGVARLLARSRWVRVAGPGLPLLTVGTWLAVWVSCWVLFHAVMAGANPRAMSLLLFSKPQLWYGLVFVAAGLWFGSRRRHEV